jgi:hypothetical protein
MISTRSAGDDDQPDQTMLCSEQVSSELSGVAASLMVMLDKAGSRSIAAMSHEENRRRRIDGICEQIHTVPATESMHGRRFNGGLDDGDCRLGRAEHSIKYSGGAGDTTLYPGSSAT